MMNQPQENIQLPENLKKAIEKSRNIVTINEAEAVRLQGLITSYEYTIRQLHNQKNELEEKVKVLNGSLDILENQKENLDSEIISKNEKIKELNDDIESLEKTIEKDRKKLKDESDIIDKKIKEFEENINEFKLKSLNLDKREQDIISKEQKLKDYFK